MASGKRPCLKLSQKFEMLDPMVYRLAIPDHHRRRRLDPKLMRGLHRIEPLLPVALRATLAPDLVDQDLSATPRNAVKPGCEELTQHCFVAHAKGLRHPVNLRWRKTVEMNSISLFQFTQQPGVILERKLRVEPALHQNPTAANCEHLFDLAVDLLVTVDISLLVAGFAVEGTKITD